MFTLPEGEESLKISILNQSIFSNMNIFLSCGHLWWFFYVWLLNIRQRRNKWQQKICEKVWLFFFFVAGIDLGEITDLNGEKLYIVEAKGVTASSLHACCNEPKNQKSSDQSITLRTFYFVENPPTPCCEGGSPVKSGLCGVLGVKLWIPTGLSVTDCGERCLSIVLNEKCPE